MNDNGTWKRKPRIESQIAKKNAEVYCKANGLVMVPEEPTETMKTYGSIAHQECEHASMRQCARVCFIAMMEAFRDQAI